MQIEIRVDDLAFATGDAIAWPVNAELRATTPLLRRLEQAGGEPLARQLRTSQPLPIGAAIVTGAGALPVELLVSAVVLSQEERTTPAGVRRAMTSALQRAADWQIEHLACAPFGLGAGNLEVEEAAEIMLDVLTRHADRSRFPSVVTIVVESDLEEVAFSAQLARRGK